MKKKEEEKERSKKKKKKKMNKNEKQSSDHIRQKEIRSQLQTFNDKIWFPDILSRTGKSRTRFITKIPVFGYSGI